MSFFINIVSRKTSHLRLISPLGVFHRTQVRQLYSPAALGIDSYLHTRKKVKEQFINLSDKFRTKMNDFVMDDKSMIFTEDLKNMVHMAEPTDLELVLKMVKKFNTQNVEYRFGSYVFGPVIMRMFHFFDAPNEALQCFEDPANAGFFEQQISYQILLDLLYNNEMYDEMYRVFDKIQQSQLNMTKFPKYSVVLILAACYKQNTPQSMEYATKLWSEMAKVGTIPVRRAAAFFAGLALKQGLPHIAMESTSMQKRHYVTIRNIRAMALADMGRIDDALMVLREVLDNDAPALNNKHTYFKETIDKVQMAIEKSVNKDYQKEFDNIVTALEDRQLIDNQTLDQLLNHEITTTKMDQQFDQQWGGQSFRNKSRPAPHGVGGSYRQRNMYQ